MIDELSYKKFIVYNNTITKAVNIDTTELEKKYSVYELIRIIDKKPLFLEDHILRLINSIKLQRIQIEIDCNRVRQNIQSLCEANNVCEGNIKLICFFNNYQVEDICYHFIYHKYPSEQDYANGVKVSFLQAVRNIPNAKLSNKSLRVLTNGIIEKQNVYEVLLVDNMGYVTEGSRSNIFGIKNNELITPPSKFVLEGVTRKHIIDLCYKNGIKLIENKILKQEIHFMDALFLTGTSLNVLPIKAVEKIQFEVMHTLTIKLIKLFNEKVKEYLNLE